MRNFLALIQLYILSKIQHLMNWRRNIFRLSTSYTQKAKFETCSRKEKISTFQGRVRGTDLMSISVRSSDKQSESVLESASVRLWKFFSVHFERNLIGSPSAFVLGSDGLEQNLPSASVLFSSRNPCSRVSETIWRSVGDYRWE